MKKTLSGYRITVEGQYFVATGEGKGKAIKRYNIVINLPSMDCALSIIKNKILNVVLAKKYPDYVSYRTHEIIDVKPFGNVTQVTATLWQMNRETVESYIHENELPVKAHIYETLMALRQAVEMSESDPDNFLLTQEKAEKDFKLTQSLRELNPELYAKPEEKSGETPEESKTEDVLAEL